MDDIKRPTALDLRRELAALLKQAAEKADAWEAAADREWAPHAAAYYDGDGTVSPEAEGPYAERLLVRAWRGQVQRMADNLSADEEK